MNRTGNVDEQNIAAFCGLGEVVLHNLKNHAAQLASYSEISDTTFGAFTEKTKNLFDQLLAISKKSEVEGTLSQGTSERLWDLIEPYYMQAENVINGIFEKQGDFIEKIFNFISYQYNHKGLLFNVAFGEYIRLVNDENTPLTPVEKALKKVIPLIVPKELLMDGQLQWREAENGGQELVVLYRGQIFSTDLIVRPGCLAPKAVSRLLMR